MTSFYKLDANHAVVPCADVLEWGRWRTEESSRVAHDEVAPDVRVSTVFLGIDHRMIRSDGPPIVFETMVFGGPLDGEQDRYCTWDEAVSGHAAMCNRASKARRGRGRLLNDSE